MNPAVEEPQVWQLSVERYHQMVQAGIITDDDPVELLQGRLITKVSKNPPHRLTTGLLREALERLISEDWHVDTQEPVTTADSEPEPDVSVVRGTRRDYLSRHPKPSEVGLVVEIADSTLRTDRGLKQEIYAQAGIWEYWIVNLIERQLEVYQNPIQGIYTQHRIYGEHESVPVNLNGAPLGVLPVKDFLP